MIITKFFPLTKTYEDIEKSKEKIMKRYNTNLVIISFKHMGFRKEQSGNVYDFMFHKDYIYISETKKD